MGAHKPTALFLYTDLKKAAPPTRMSILKKNFQNAIFHTKIYGTSLWAVILKIEASLQSDATLTCGIPYFFVFVRQF
jgi:hypothetical protein